jgi:hypothetical protein
MERAGSTNSLRVLLDNQQWNYLAAPGEYPDGAGLDADDLGDAVRCGEIEVVGSIDILQEIIESARTRAVKYGRMIGLFFEFVGRRVLIPLNDRHPREAGDGGLLSDGRGYLSRDDRRQLERLANNRRDVVHVADDLYAEKTSFAHQETVLRQKMRQKLNDEIEDFRFPKPQAWFDATDLDDWVASVVHAGVERGRYGVESVEPVSYSRYPSAYSFVAARLARVILVNAEGRRVNPSDLADAHHLAAGPYVDLIVSDDKGMLDAHALFADRVSFKVLTSKQFSELTGVRHRTDSVS